MAFLKKCINVYIMRKKAKLINHDCLPIFMFLYIMPAYLMMFAAVSNAVCLHNASFFLFLPLIFANAFCFNALSWFIDTLFVYFKYYLASFTVHLICWFFLILCSHCFFNILNLLRKGYVRSGEITLEDDHHYYYY